MTQLRRQQTIARTARVSGFGLFYGADVELEFCPADDDTGLVFERVDLGRGSLIPALVEYVTPQSRCTMLAHRGVQVALVEHVLAALAGLRVDNCLIRLNALEPPIGDGSARHFVEALAGAGIVEQTSPRGQLRLTEEVHLTDGDAALIARPTHTPRYEVTYDLDYGMAGIAPQSFGCLITPQTFRDELASCRTFALERDVDQLRSAGLCRRATTENAIVVRDNGGIFQTTLRTVDEFARHKLLDCIGDFALLGCDLVGSVRARCSGHRHNCELIRRLRRLQAPTLLDRLPDVAAPRRAG